MNLILTAQPGRVRMPRVYRLAGMVKSRPDIVAMPEGEI